MIDESRTKLGITDDPATTQAVTLAALAHATRDVATWGGMTYWDQLAGRILLATYRAHTPAEWWEQMSRTMGCQLPTKAEDRDLLAVNIAPNPAALNILATQTEAVALRVRLAWEHHFGPKSAANHQESLL